MDLFSAQTDSVSESRWGLVLDTDSGWIRTTTGLLMLWIPPWLREGLNLPHNTLVITKDGTTRLDLSHFVHGTEWATCANPAFMKSMS
ncbi:hypothetical protein DFH06DRAFT_1213905 [Mycena polygramma]|nr:hypothetical protein DFH06DRAFT_1213905 [Mycena polygramma]